MGYLKAEREKEEQKVESYVGRTVRIGMTNKDCQKQK